MILLLSISFLFSLFFSSSSSSFDSNSNVAPVTKRDLQFFIKKFKSLLLSVCSRSLYVSNISSPFNISLMILSSDSFELLYISFINLFSKVLLFSKTDLFFNIKFSFKLSSLLLLFFSFIFLLLLSFAFLTSTPSINSKSISKSLSIFPFSSCKFLTILTPSSFANSSFSTIFLVNVTNFSGIFIYPLFLSYSKVLTLQ